MAAKPRKRYKVAYPGYEECTLNIIPANVNAAINGDVGMQNSVAWQYFKALGMSRPPSGWAWARFSITNTGQDGRPPRNSHKTPQSTTAKSQGTCCGNDNCKVCDNGDHGWCRNGCTLWDR